MLPDSDLPQILIRVKLPATMPKAESKNSPLETFGIPTIEGAHQLHYDMCAFAMKRKPEQGALPRHQHFWRISDMLFEDRIVERNPWAERIIHALCYNTRVGLIGCAAAGKTHVAAYYGVIYWLCDPGNTTVILTSSTLAMIKKRAWPLVQRSEQQIIARDDWNFVDSVMEWQAKPNDHLNCVCGIAVKQGSVEEAAGRIAGLHNRRVLSLVDEAPDTPEGIFEACSNLRSGATDFQLILSGNIRSKLDVFGKFCAPAGGWKSVGLESQGWKANPYMSLEKAEIVRLDSEQSPNVLLGYRKWRGLISLEDVQEKRVKHGPDSPTYWSQDRAFPPPEGVCRTVMSETFLEQYGVFDRQTFMGETWRIASFDPAFGGGDKAIVGIGTVGETTKGITGCQIDEYLYIDVNSMEKKTLHYQLAREVISILRRNGVEPKHFFTYVAAEGAGPASIIVDEWSPNIVWVEEGGSPTTSPVSPADMRPRDNVYDRKVTEIWFQAKEFCASGQLKGMSNKAAQQFCTREFSEGAGGRSVLEKKIDYKNRVQESPDEADVTALIAYGMHLLGIPIMGTKAAKARVVEAKKVSKVANEVYASQGYAPWIDLVRGSMWGREESDRYLPEW